MKKLARGTDTGRLVAPRRRSRHEQIEIYIAAILQLVKPRPSAAVELLRDDTAHIERRFEVARLLWGLKIHSLALPRARRLAFRLHELFEAQVAPLAPLRRRGAK